MHNRVLAFFLLVFLFPILIFVSLAIWLEDGWPIFFVQKREGKNSNYFHIYKFRSMKKNTPNLPTHLLENPGNYLLEIGKWIRKTSIDELPNLINIIKGEMVFVGPRPALYNQDDLLKLRISTGVDQLKPGITGWAQVNGRDEISDHEKVAFDTYYLKNKSFCLDLKIIYLTFFKVLLVKGVKH